MEGGSGGRRIVILGGGFGGLYAALHLAGREVGGAPLDVAIVDRVERFTFKPLLYDLLTGELAEEDVAPSFADLLSGSPVRFVRAEVSSIDLAARRVVLSAGEPGAEAALAFDALVVALGAEPYDFGVPGVVEHALPATTVEDFRRIRARVEALAGEGAGAPPTVAVCGAGPSGVEIACKLAEPGASGRGRARLDVVLVEARAEILPGFSPVLRDTAARALERKGVRLRLGAAVRAVDARGLVLAGKGGPDERLPAALSLWTGGQRPPRPVRELEGVARDRSGRLVVPATLELASHPGVFAIGDDARCALEGEDPPPATAQVAVQQASVCARNVIARLEGRPLASYRYLPLVEALTLGRATDALELLGLRLEGYPAFALRRLFYLFRQPGPAGSKVGRGLRLFRRLLAAGIDAGIARWRGSRP